MGVFDGRRAATARTRHGLAGSAVLAGAVLLVGCSGGDSDSSTSPSTMAADPPASSAPATTAAEPGVDGIPQGWLTTAAAAWPSSDGFGAEIPRLKSGADCSVQPSLPVVLGTTPEITAAGWGPYGARNDDQDSFRYICQISGEGYAGQLQLIVSSNPSWLRQTMDTFTHQPDSKVQDNTVTTVESGGHTVQVLKRWYPTNPQGEYQAMFLDEKAGAIVVWDINSLNKADFHTYSPQQAADDLMGMLRAD